MGDSVPTPQENRVRGKQEALQAHKISDTEYRVYNVAKGTAYSVLKVKGVENTWVCTCLWAQKKSSSNPDICKHLQRVIDREMGCGACGRVDEYAGLKRERVDEPFLCAPCRLLIKDITHR